MAGTFFDMPRESRHGKRRVQGTFACGMVTAVTGFVNFSGQQFSKTSNAKKDGKLLI